MRKSKEERFQEGPIEIQGCQIVETLHSVLQSNRLEDPPHRMFVVYGKKENDITFLSLKEYVRTDSLSRELIEQVRKEIKEKEKLPQHLHEDTKKLLPNMEVPEKLEKNK